LISRHDEHGEGKSSQQQQQSFLAVAGLGTAASSVTAHHMWIVPGQKAQSWGEEPHVSDSPARLINVRKTALVLVFMSFLYLSEFAKDCRCCLEIVSDAYLKCV